MATVTDSLEGSILDFGRDYESRDDERFSAARHRGGRGETDGHEAMTT